MRKRKYSQVENMRYYIIRDRFSWLVLTWLLAATFPCLIFLIFKTHKYFSKPMINSHKETFKRKPQEQIKHEKTRKFYIYIPFGEILFSMAIFLETKQELMIERVGLFLRAREHERRQITVFREGQSWLDFASRGKSWSMWLSVFGGRLIFFFFFFFEEDVWTQSDTCCLPDILNSVISLGPFWLNEKLFS